MPTSPLISITFVLVVISLWVWAALRLRQKDRQVIGSAALLVSLIAWGIPFLFSPFYSGGRPPMPPWAAVAYGLFSLLGILLSVILAIVGLCLWSSRAEGIRRGKRSAIFTLVVNVLFVGLALTAALTAKNGPFGKPRQNAGSDAFGPIEGARITMDQQNFSIVPSRTWMRMPDAKKVNPESCLAMRIPRPETWVIAIVEEAAELNMDLYEDVIRSNFTSGGSKVAPESREQKTANGYTFRILEAETALKGPAGSIPIRYECWIASIEGRAYQFVFWAPAATGKLTTETRKFMDSFRTLGKPAGERFKDIASAEWGVETSLGALGWNEWPEAKDSDNHALVRGLQPFRGVQVIPMHWGEKAPDQEAATAALLGLVDLTYPSGVDGRKPWTDPKSGISGYEYTADRKVDQNPVHYRLRIAHRENISWLIATWSVGDPAPHVKMLEDTLAAVTLSAPQGNPPVTRLRTSAMAYNGAALFHHSAGRFTESEALFRQATQYDPNDEIMFGNHINALVELGKYDEAIARFEKLPPSLASSGTLMQSHGAVLVAAKRPLEADPLYRKALAAHSLDDDAALNWIRSLLDAEESKAALAAATTYSDSKPNAKTLGWLAEVMASNGDFDGALGVLRKLVEQNPHQPELRLTLAETSNRADRSAEAETILNELIAEGKDNARTRLALGFSFMNRRWYRQAKEAFEAALKFSPQNEEAKAALSECSTLLGQASNSGIKEPIEPVALPPSLQTRIAARSAVAPAENDHARYLTFVTGWHFLPEKSLRQTMHRKIEILDAAAVSDFSSLEFAFDPTFERIHVNRLEVFDREGKRISSGNIDDYYVLDTPGDAADDGKTLHVPVAGLSAGTRIEFEISKEYLHAPKSFSFDRFMFGASKPIVAEAVFFTGDLSAIKAHLSFPADIETFGDETMQAWLAKPSAGSISEVGAPDLETSYPVLRIGSPSGTWADAGKEYLGQIRAQLKSEKDFEAVVKEIAPADAKASVRAAAIARYVQQSVNYLAVEFGPRGRIPRPAAETLKRKHGDCKDHAVLLHQLLKTAGIPSQLVLVHTSWNVDDKIADLNQFNHMIVRIPDLRPFPYVDPTSKVTRAGELPPWAFWEKNALVLDEEKPFLTQLPAKPADCAALKITRDATIADDGSVVTDEQITFTGYYANSIRNYLIGQTKARQLDLIQDIFSSRGGYQVESVDFPDPTNPLLEPVMKLRYRKAPDASSAELVLPAVWETDYLAIAFINQRKTPFECALPTRIDSETTLRATRPFSATYLEALQGSDKNEFCRWKSEAAPGENPRIVKVSYDFETQARIHPPERYTPLRDAWNASLAHTRRRIDFEKP